MVTKEIAVSTLKEIKKNFNEHSLEALSINVAIQELLDDTIFEFNKLENAELVAKILEHDKNNVNYITEPNRRSKAKWIEYKPEHGLCNKCGHTVDLTVPEETRYCSNCGSQMTQPEKLKLENCPFCGGIWI